MKNHIFFRALLCTLLSLAPSRPMGTPDADPPAAEPRRVASLDVHAFRIVEGSGSVYYQVVKGPAGPFIRADFRPGLQALTAGIRLPEAVRQTAQRLRWRWQVREFPREGDQCRDGYGDSAATVFATFKHGLRWYIIKYAWNSVGPKGLICDHRRTPVLARETVVLESGGPRNVWVSEEVDLREEFRRLFENGHPDADVPDFVGVGIATDGDDTKSASAGDYGSFEVSY